jgi:hypothetical protein
MDSWHGRIKNGLLNAGLLVVGLGVMVLLYGLVTRTLTPSPDPQRSDETTKLVGSIIQVEVRNGAGVDRLAAQTTHYLRERGFDVVDVGNYSSFQQERSVVIDRVGDLEAARKVAEALGLPTDRVRQDIRRQYYLDASVIIGHDYKQLRPFQNQE